MFKNIMIAAAAGAIASSTLITTLSVIGYDLYRPKDHTRASVAEACMDARGVFSFKVDQPPEGTAQKITQITCNFK